MHYVFVVKDRRCLFALRPSKWRACSDAKLSENRDCVRLVTTLIIAGGYSAYLLQILCIQKLVKKRIQMLFLKAFSN